jgi:prophage antirepressor-like protein
MKLVNSDTRFDYFIDYFQGIEVKIKKDKLTQQIYFNSESVAQCLGFSNTAEMIQSNEKSTNIFLDGMNKGEVITGF